MNTLHLKYAVEVEKTRSINKAAENLFMGQPNLSRAIRELEEGLGITIFNRTSRGITVTPQGEEFLQRAKSILRQLEDMETLYLDSARKKQSFSASVPRATYLSYAFARFSAQMDTSRPAEFFYKETNSSRTINNLLHRDYHIGIIRYAKAHEKHWVTLLKEKHLKTELITSFSYKLVMSHAHPLAQKDEITFADLTAFTEVAHGDPYVPSVSMAAVRKEELPDNISRRIFVFERASQCDLLSMTPGTFMWVSPFPADLLKRYDLVQRECKENTKEYRDVLVYSDEYTLTDLDKRFLEQVRRAAGEMDKNG